MRLSKVTYALIAAGVGAGLATGYTHLDTLAGRRRACRQRSPPALAAQLVAAPTVAANLPDFTALVDRARGVRRQHQHLPREGERPCRIRRTTMKTVRRTNSSSASAECRTRRAMRPQQPSRGVGSGFIVSPDGYIVTNAHVVDGATEVVVKLTDRREFTAKVIGSDKRTDIAVVKIDAKNLPALDLAAKPGGEAGRMGDRDRLAISGSRTACRPAS